MAQKPIKHEIRHIMKQTCKFCGQKITEEIKVEGYFWDRESQRWVKKIEVPKEIKDAEEESC